MNFVKKQNFGCKKMFNAKTIISAFLPIIVIIAGCTHSDTFLKAQPSTFLPYTYTNKNNPVVSGSTPPDTYNVPDLGVSIVAFKASGQIDTPNSGHLNGPVVYVAADVSYLIKYESKIFAGQDSDMVAKRNKLMDLLINISDYNCRLFLSRMYAANGNANFASGMVNDVFTAASGGTAPYLAPAAVGFSAANLFAKSTVQQYTSSYLGGQTMPAIANQIIAARITANAALQQKKSIAYNSYNVFAVINDINYYDSLASVNAGIDQLNSSSQDVVKNASLNTVTSGSAPIKSGTVNTGAPLSSQVTAISAGATLPPAPTPVPASTPANQGSGH